MVREQAENCLYQPTPLPKNRVIIKMVDGTWTMHQIIARVSSSPREELIRYRGYFLVRNLLTGKEKVLPLVSGFAWEIIHNIMDAGKLKSIKDRMQNPGNEFNDYPTAEMTTPSVEELGMLYGLDQQHTTSDKNLDDEIEQFLIQSYPGYRDNPEEIFAGILPGPIMRSPPPPTKEVVDDMETPDGAESLQEPLQGLISVTPTLRKQLPRSVKGFAPTRFDGYKINYPGDRLLQQERSEILDPLQQEETYTENPTSNLFSTN